MTDVFEQTNELLSAIEALQLKQQIADNPKPPDPPYKELATARRLANAVANAPTPTEPSADPSDPLLPSVPLPVPFELWEALAYDIVLDNATSEVIAEGYKITEDQLACLKEHPHFMKMLEVKREEVKSLGTDAAFTVKFRMIANRAAGEYLKRLTSVSTSTKDFHTLFKTAVELGQLLPQEEDDQPQQVFGASVTFNIQGVPGLEHLTPAIDATSPEDVEDGVFTEVTPADTSNSSTADDGQGED